MSDYKTTYDENTATVLDRVWAATRPVEPSSEAFDRIWTEVRAACDRPAALPLAGAGRTSGRRMMMWGSIGLAQAASLLVVFRVLFFDSAAPSTPPAQAAPMAVLTHINVDPDETLMIKIDDSGGDYLVQKIEEPVALAFNVDVKVGNDHDALGFWEARSGE